MLGALFQDRKRLSFRYDMARKLAAKKDESLEFLSRFGVIRSNGDFIELDDVYLKFFEYVNEVNEEINVASVKESIGNLAEPLTAEELSEQSHVMQMVDAGEVKTAFMASGTDLFNFIMNYSGYRKPVTEEEKLVLFCQIAAQYHDELSVSNEYRSNGSIKYPLIYPKTA